MKKSKSHNRQLPLAEKYDRQIHRTQMSGNEKIIAEQCKAMARKKSEENAKSEPSDITIFVASYMKDESGPGAFSFAVNSFWDGKNEVAEVVENTYPHILEVKAINSALESVELWAGSITLYTNEENVARCFSEGKVAKWKEAKWRNCIGAPIPDSAEWAKLLEVVDKRRVKILYLDGNTSGVMKSHEDMAKWMFKEGTPTAAAAN